MKQSILLIFAAIVVCSCGGSGGKRIEHIGKLTFDSIVADSSYTLTQERNSPKCNVRISLTYVKNDKGGLINKELLRCGILTPDYFSLTNDHIGMKQAVDSFVKNYVNDYRNDYGELYKVDKEHGASYNCTYEVSTQVRRGDKDVFVYIASILTYAGGEHAIKQTIARNFNSKSGHLITLEDVFVPGYEQTLKDIIVGKLCDKFSAKDIGELSKKYIFADGNVYVPDNFILDGDNITFIYCEDEIAPHDIGEIRVAIDKDDISKLLK